MKLLKPLVRLAYPYGSVRTVRRGPLKGQQFVVRPAMGGSFAWRAPEHWEWFRDRLPPGSVVHDVGANRGQMALLFGWLVGPAGSVVSFEPVPSLFADLTHNLKLNGLDWVKPLQAAVSDHQGSAVFQLDQCASTQGKLASVEPSHAHGTGETITVPTVRLDDYPPPRFIKIDVEGAAGKVLAGARHLLNTAKPDLYIELHGPEERQTVTDLGSRGYRICRLDGSPAGDIINHWVNPLWCRSA